MDNRLNGCHIISKDEILTSPNVNYTMLANMTQNLASYMNCTNGGPGLTSNSNINHNNDQNIFNINQTQSSSTNDNDVLGPIFKDPDNLNGLTLLALIDPAYTSRNSTIFKHVEAASAKVLRFVGNEAFAALEREVSSLQKETTRLWKANDELQTYLLRLQAENSDKASASLPHSNDPSSSSHTNGSLPAQNNPTNISHAKPNDCNITWWSAPSEHSPAFEKVNSSGDDDDTKVYAWMQQKDGTVISQAMKKHLHKSHHRSLNGMNYRKSPQNWSSLDISDINTYVRAMEEENPWLAFCEGSWKAKEVLKRNYWSWKRTYDARQAEKAEAPGQNPTEDDDQKKKKKKKEKEKGRKGKRAAENADDTPGTVSQLPPVPDDWSTFTDHHDTEDAQNQSSASLLKNADELHGDKELAVEGTVVNGSLSTRKFGPVIHLASIDVDKLGAKAKSHLQQRATVTSTIQDAPLASATPSSRAACSAPSPHNITTAPTSSTLAETTTTGPTTSTIALSTSVPGSADGGATESPIERVPIVEELTKKVKKLPTSLPTAPRTHVFATYSTKDPSTLTAGIADHDLWVTFDGPITKLIPTGDHGAREHLVVRGTRGLPAFVQLVRHLAYDRKMDTRVLEPKLQRLIDTIDHVVKSAGSGKRKETDNDAAAPSSKRQKKSDGTKKTKEGKERATTDASE